ncbi:MSHA biogenesis protein MshL [Candidatus Electrothrix aarhusensis]|uniref:MSHA biogenesis protein MshL n=1 Tax=Candidatus Electrothrix aarhusensis TaxID=1859131 RepID=A0A3S3QFE4_9BACT|nr:MSHA biogenesis protein MshL [Candidatus Electrothrix aarhusensis]
MKSNTRLLHSVLAVTAATLLLCSCVGKKSEDESKQTARLAAPEKKQRTVIEPSLLPQRFQRAGYMINDDEVNAMLDSDASDDFQLKVGADITTHEPITLREAMKALVRNKKMSLSWASDVNQDLLVDIDLTANDNFYEAIDNILRQLDYFHEMQGSTLIIKYRETKQYQVAMPFIKQNYETQVGGDMFGNNEAMRTTKGSIKIDSEKNEFDMWENISKNLDVLISTWSATTTSPEESGGDIEKDQDKGDEAEEPAAQVSQRVSSTESSYTIDKPVGLITVHAPKSLQKRINDYLTTLERELYKQIIIEAKIIEVQLRDGSSLGINWNTILQSLNFTGGGIGVAQSYSKGTSESNQNGTSFSDTSTRTSGTSNDSISTNLSSSNDSTSSLASSSTSSSGEDSTSSGSGSTGSTGGTTGFSELSDISSTSNSIADVLTSGTTAASTLATLITGGASNAAAAGISLAAFSFDKFINALKQQGQTSVLSNPKISVMNGQPALITVGRNVTYIDNISTKLDKDTNVETYLIKTDRILSGVGLALSAVVKKNNDIVMNLVPVTSELAEDIEYMEIGSSRIGLPVVNIREMSTTVTVKNNSILVLGGLISETEISDGDFLYGTENMPYLKYLFGYEEKKKVKRELIILLRPRII